MSIESILKNREGQEKALIQRAYDLADQAHKEQTRSSGEPYIIHPIAVAKFLADLNLDSKTIAAALLHDVLEDTNISREQLEKEFGQEIAFLVDGVTKLEQIQFKQKSSADWATLRKMLFAMTKDIRIILIKLADRWHNLSTIKYLPPDRQQSYATESIEIFAPIAERLGMGNTQGKLFVGLSDENLSSDRMTSNCGTCDDGVRREIQAFNGHQEVARLRGLYHECKDEWRKEVGGKE